MYLNGVMFKGNFQNLKVNFKCYLWKKNEVIVAGNCEYQFRIIKEYK